MGEPLCSIFHLQYQPLLKVYHGRRNGSRKDLAMHRSHVDASQAISTFRQTYNRQVHHRLPKQFGEELGQRVRHVIYFTSVSPLYLLDWQ